MCPTTTSISRPTPATDSGATTQGEYNREKKNGLVSTDNYSGQYALDRFIDDHWFWQGQVAYKRDMIEDLAKRTVGTGPGYQFWDNELGAFSIATLVNRNDYEFADGEKEHFYSSSFKWDYNRYLLAKQFELFTNGEVSKPLQSGLDYELQTEAGIRYKLTSWASLSMKAEWDKFSGNDGNVNQRRYTFGLGSAGKPAKKPRDSGLFLAGPGPTGAGRRPVRERGRCSSRSRRCRPPNGRSPPACPCASEGCRRSSSPALRVSSRRSSRSR